MSDVDQEALAAEWEAAAAGEQPDFDSIGEADNDAGDELASEWEAMVGGEAETFLPNQGSSGAERILNQEEIDSLLGFSVSDDEANERSGIRAIINSALVSYERLPMLEIVFDRLVRLMTTSLRNFTSD
ncbi:MAG: flagellar motor switch protein FliM, partial [Oceanicaulis sp.]